MIRAINPFVLQVADSLSRNLSAPLSANPFCGVALRGRNSGLANAQHLVEAGEGATNLGLSTLYHCGTAKPEQLNGEFKMSLKKATVAAILAVSMASTPVLAQSTPSAASLSVAARGGTTDAGRTSDIRGGFIIPVVAVVAIILGILALTGGSNDHPHSP